jgi:hypothetical protein
MKLQLEIDQEDFDATVLALKVVAELSKAGPEIAYKYLDLAKRLEQASMIVEE